MPDIYLKINTMYKNEKMSHRLGENIGKKTYLITDYYSKYRKTLKAQQWENPILKNGFKMHREGTSGYQEEGAGGWG